MVNEAITIDLWGTAPEDWKGHESRLLENFAAYEGSSEEATFDALKLPGRRHEFLVSRLLLTNALEEHGQTPRSVSRDDQGKPFLKRESAEGGGPVYFNLSYSEGLVVCGATRRYPLGVDVESIGRKLGMDAVAARYFAPGERAVFSAVTGKDQREVFFGLWTLKEAFLKGLGTGLRTSVLSCAFDLQTTGHVGLALAEDVKGTAEEWHLTLLAAADHRIALACRAGRETPVHIIWRRVLPEGIVIGTPLRVLRCSNSESTRCTVA